VRGHPTAARRLRVTRQASTLWARVIGCLSRVPNSRNASGASRDLLAPDRWVIRPHGGRLPASGWNRMPGRSVITYARRWQEAPCERQPLRSSWRCCLPGPRAPLQPPTRWVGSAHWSVSRRRPGVGWATRTSPASTSTPRPPGARPGRLRPGAARSLHVRPVLAPTRHPCPAGDDGGVRAGAPHAAAAGVRLWRAPGRRLVGPGPNACAAVTITPTCVGGSSAPPKHPRIATEAIKLLVRGPLMVSAMARRLASSVRSWSSGQGGTMGTG
jgi:hypothetical protein